MARFNNQGTATNPAGTSQDGNLLPALRQSARFLFAGGMGYVMLLNVQPWLELSRKIASQITTIPFLDSLVHIPFLGGWIQWAFTNTIPILGCILWAIVQLIEIAPEFVNAPDLKKRLQHFRWVAYAIETVVCFLRFPPYAGGMTAILEDSPNWDVNLIDWWMLVLFVITMFGFELCIRVIVTVWKGLK